MSCSSPAARTSEVTDHLVVVLKITLGLQCEQPTGTWACGSIRRARALPHAGLRFPRLGVDHACFRRQLCPTVRQQLLTGANRWRFTADLVLMTPQDADAL